MADEEKKKEDNNQEVADAAAEQAPADEPKTEEPKAEEPKAEEPKAEEPKAEEPKAAGDGEQQEEGEALTSKQLRKRERSKFQGPAREPQTQEQRSAERAKVRADKSKQRQRWRGKQREKAAAAGPGAAKTASTVVEPGKRKTRQGIVVSSKAEKTITVRIDNVRRHRTYGKVLRETTTLHAHDEANEAGEGDTVRILECRPLSRLKRWRLIEVLEKAK
jgi:small subunit ribosomal protein S17